MSADPTAAGRLCSSCGLCCNGVMFHTVRLQPRDSPKALAALGLKLKRRNKHHYIHQPCPAHCGTQCTIYEQRPERCRVFECRQLTRLAAGTITEATAQARIDDVLRRVRNLEALLKRGGATDPRRPLSKRYEKIMVELLADPMAEATAPLREELTREMHALDEILDHEFRLPAEGEDTAGVAPMDEPQTLLAAYGTLLRGQPGQELAHIQDQLTYLRPCTVPGVLYDLGEYPGLVPGDGTVKAELYALREASTFALLDDYEGCVAGDPASLFTRQRVRLPGEEVDCWVYYYNGSVAALPPIQSGDWIGYLGSRPDSH